MYYLGLHLIIVTSITARVLLLNFSFLIRQLIPGISLALTLLYLSTVFFRINILSLVFLRALLLSVAII